MKYRKKPVVVEAWRVADLIKFARGDWASMPEPVNTAYELAGLFFLPDGIDVKTLEGTMRADKHDWLICGIRGELYPCKPNIFDATYEAVE